MASNVPAPKPVFDDPEEASTKCNEWVDSGLTKNKAIQFLLSHLVGLGCEPPAAFIQCTQCPQPAAGGFGIIQETSYDRKPTACQASTYQQIQEQLQREERGASHLRIQPEIYLCQQYLDSERMTHKTMVHELIHAIDQCRTKMDPLHNCVHMACTEIRAENLSGECSFWKELPRMESFKNHGAECVKRRAILSVRANPNCTNRADQYVNAAFDRCFRDNYPFERHPNQL